MRTRQPWLVLAFLLLLPGEVMAHRHRAGVFYIPSLLLYHSHYTSWAGFSGELPIRSDRHGISVIGDFSRYSGTDDGEEFTLFTYMAGASYTSKRKVAPFVELLVGGVRASQEVDIDTTKHATRGIAALGGGLTMSLLGEETRPQLSLRLQVELVRFNGKTGFAPAVGLGVQFP